MTEPSVEGLREAIAALKPASNLQGSPVNAYCMARDAALALIDAARAGEGLREAALRLLDAERGLGPASHAVAVANLRAALHPDTAEEDR